MLLNYSVWREYSDKLVISDFPKELAPLYSSLNGFHAANEQQINLTVPDLANLVLAHTHKDKEYYLELLSNLDKLEVAEETTSVLISSILDNKKLKEISLAAYDVTEGRMSREKIVALFQDFLSVSEDNKQDEDEFVSDDIEFIVEHAFKKPGLRWRLNTMNKMLGSLRHGDFGFIYARPETGKTTFLCSELTYMAEQAEGDILWLANEEDDKKVMLRLYQAAFGIDLPTLMSDLSYWRKEWKKKFDGKIKLVGRLDVMTKSGVQKLADKLKPSLIVIDQLSKIGGFDGDRKDLELGAACEWGRKLAKTYAPTIAVHQADGTAEGVKWLTMNHVSSAKTAMQAEADWMLGIGKVHDAGYENLRYLALSKNKLSGDPDTDPNLRHGKMEVLINAHIARYIDI